MDGIDVFRLAPVDLVRVPEHGVLLVHGPRLPRVRVVRVRVEVDERRDGLDLTHLDSFTSGRNPESGFAIEGKNFNSKATEVTKYGCCCSTAL